MNNISTETSKKKEKNKICEKKNEKLISNFVELSDEFFYEKNLSVSKTFYIFLIFNKYS